MLNIMDKTGEFMFETEKFVKNLDELFDNPKQLGNATPTEWYEFLKNANYDPKPLNRGNYANLNFKQGGGFRVFWGGDKILQYHPPGRTHHGEDAYWKLSSGKTQRLRYDLLGNKI